MSVKAIPDGYPRITPYLHVEAADAAIDFYKAVFGATERVRMPAPGGKVGHCELQLGDSILMLADTFPEMGALSPRQVGGTPVTLHVYVDDVDAVVAAAVGAGATAIGSVENQFYGDRSGQFKDPFGHQWNIATHVEDVAPDEMGRRAAAMFGGGEGTGH